MQSKSNLFVKGLPFNVTDEFFRSLFAKFGAIKSYRIKRPDISRSIQPTKLYSIAFLEYLREEDAAKAIAEMSG
jgi:RNA recognition motif-containing protein